MSDIQGSGIVWEDPPVNGAGSKPRGKHAEIAAQLRANPGKWAKVATSGANSTATAIKRGTISAYQPSGSFEAVTRGSRHMDGRKSLVSDVYARYIGDGAT